MSFNTRFIWCLALVTFVSGCATHKSAYLPGQYTGLPSEQNDATVVQQGAIVRVALTNGEVVLGEVVRVSDREMVVERSGDYGSGRATILSDDIRKIEVEDFSRSEATVAKTIAITIGVVAVGVAIFAYSLRGLGD